MGIRGPLGVIGVIAGGLWGEGFFLSFFLSEKMLHIFL